MTDIAVVAESIDECQRYLTRAGKALESLQRGEDNNTYTAAMKRASLDLSNSLVAVRGNNKEAREKPPKKAAKAPDFPAHVETATKEFIESLPRRTCFKCGQKFNSENPCKWKGEIHCDDCFDLVSQDADEEEVMSGTQPDPEQYHCQECGLLYTKKEWCFEYGTCTKCAEHLDFKEMKDRKARAEKYESIEHPEKPLPWKSIPESKNGEYRCPNDESVEIRYNMCAIVKLSWVEIWSLVNYEGNLKEELYTLLGKGWTGQKNAGISAFVKAVRAEKIPEALEAV